MVIEKAMQLDRNLRFQNIEEFKEALLSIMEAKQKNKNRWQRIGIWAGLGFGLLLLVMAVFSVRGCQRITPGAGTPINAPTVQPLLTGIMQRISGSLTPQEGLEESTPSPTPSGIQEEIVSPTVEIQPTQPYLIYVREGPGREYPVIGEIRNETRFNVIGRNREGDWLYIMLSNGEEGWAFAEVITYYTGYQGDVEALPTVKPIVTPPATTTKPPP
jgi:hypothetical protein